MATILEQAGSVGSTGAQAILDLQPPSLHEPAPVILGSTLNVAALPSGVCK